MMTHQSRRRRQRTPVLLTGMMLLMTSVLAMVGPRPVPFPPEKPWQCLTLGVRGGLEVRLEYLPQASMADERWLRFAFVNEGDEPVAYKRLDYRIQGSRRRGSSIEGPGGVVLGSGSAESLKRAAGVADWRDSRFQPGVLRCAEQPSRYAASVLGVPEGQSRIVHARLHVDVEFEDGTTMSAPAAGLPFLFKWQRPSPDDRSMHERLVRMFANPDDYSEACDDGLLGTLLAIPQASRGISLATISAAMAARGHDDYGRRQIASGLHRIGIERADRVASFVRRLRAEDVLVCDDLMRAPADFWDEAFLEPLVALVESGVVDAHWTSAPHVARPLAVLDRHSDRWCQDASVRQRLFAAERQRLQPILSTSAATLRMAAADGTWGRLQQWRQAVDRIAISRDPRAFDLLEPFLDCSTPLFDWTRCWCPAPPPPGARYWMLQWRVRDVALEAMLKVRYGSKVQGYERLGIPQPEHQGLHVAASDPVRGVAIRALRRVLAK